MFHKNIRIQLADTDSTGRIHYSFIFRFFEQLDHEFFRSIGYSYQDLFQKDFEMPRVHVECNYMGNIQYDDELEGRISIKKVGNTSFTYQIQLFNEDRMVVQGTMTIVFISSSTGKKMPIPEYIKEKLEEHLVKETIGEK